MYYRSTGSFLLFDYHDEDDDDDFEGKSGADGKLLLGDCLSFISRAIVPNIQCNINIQIYKYTMQYTCILLCCVVSHNKYSVSYVLYCVALYCCACSIVLSLKGEVIISVEPEKNVFC